jgi:parallel beta-helix repeat protein
VKCVGTSGTHKHDVKIIGGGTITRAGGDTNHVELVRFEYVDDFSIAESTIDDGHTDGLYIVNCTNGKLEGTVKILDCAGTGLKILASTVVIAVAITITGCGIGYEIWPSIDTDKMYHGDCESTDEPMLDNETVPFLENCTSWARSDTVAYGGTYSYKLLPDANGFGRANLVDSNGTTYNDLHGLTPGKSYFIYVKAYPSGEVWPGFQIRVSLNGSSWDAAFWSQFGLTYARTAIASQWNDVYFVLHVPLTATGVMIAPLAYLTDPADRGDGITCVYYDDVHIYEFDDTDSGCQLVNSSISDCTDTGVIATVSHALIQNNQITGNTKKGLVIAAGYRNIVSGNRCYNNGADTGIANDNQDNFYDAGIDTQVS